MTMEAARVHRKELRLIAQRNWLADRLANSGWCPGALNQFSDRDCWLAAAQAATTNEEAGA